ncbi:MAG: PIN domain-containing protein [Steroidobacteraceae bacterium]
MSEKLLLVDYENIGKIDLGAIPTGVRVLFFFGASQKSVPKEFLKAALKLGERFVPVDIEGQGKNALDFHVAYYLGEYLTRSPELDCAILSRDKGFDVLVRHLAGRGFSVRHVGTVAECFPPAKAAERPAARRAARPRAAVPRAPAADAPLARALKRLAGLAANKRPHRRRGLVAELHSHLAKKLTEAEVEALVDQLAAAGKLTDTDGRISYHF